MKAHIWQPAWEMEDATPISSTDYLCNLEQISQPLCASVPSLGMMEVVQHMSQHC